MGHAHNHSHGHGHNHTHSHSETSGRNFGWAFGVGIILNLAFVAIEAGYGYFTNSLALMSDAGHNLSDVVGLVLAWFAIWLSTRKRSNRFTYGLKGSSILAALTNAVILLVAVGAIIWEAVHRFSSPQPVMGSTVMVVAGIGILINGATALMFMAGSKDDLNIRGAFLHMAADALVSLGVVISGFAILKTGFQWIDPVVSIVIGLVIIASTWGLLKDSVLLSLAGAPAGLDVGKIETSILSESGVRSIHDLHVWGISTSQAALTAHVNVVKGEDTDGLIRRIEHRLAHDFGLRHITLQLETQENQSCINPSMICT